MINSFQSISDEIDGRVESLEWITDTGITLHGVLYKDEQRFLLNVNTKDLTEAVKFNYLYHENQLGGRRVLYPFDIQSAQVIPYDKFYENWYVEVFMLVDETNIPESNFDGITVYTYDSFLWFNVPETKAQKAEHEALISRISKVETTIGKVTFGIGGTDSSSRKPPVLEKRMDEIDVIIERDEPFSNKELLMWNTRFSQLMTILHRERVVLKGMETGLNKVLVPSLMENYKEASYAFRNLFTLEDFVEIIEKILPTFIEKYDELVGVFEDLVQYYRDYPLDPPDNIQLLRLFSGLEQSANHFTSHEPKKNVVLNDEELARSSEFDSLLAIAAQADSITSDLHQFLSSESKKYYVSPEDPTSTKIKIIALANMMTTTYEFHSYLKNPDDVKCIWDMRNIVAHGFFNEKASDEFYSRRDDYGQAIEQMNRMYFFHLASAGKDLVLKHKDPLKARQFHTL